MKTEDVSFTEFLDDYFSESEEHLGSIRRYLLVMEGFVNSVPMDPGVPDAMNELLHALHSIKGLSAMVGIREAEQAAHDMEVSLRDMKQAGTGNWDKLQPMIDRIEAARASGTRITADMYTYTAGATGLDAAMPPWVREGGYGKWQARLKDPALRVKVAKEMKERPVGWDNLYFQAGSPDKVLFLAFKNPALKKYTGKTLADVARERGKSAEETAMYLVVEDGTRVGTAYFLMSEENVARQAGLPWMAFDSDESAQAPRGVFLKSNTHPRAYGNFARLLGKYVREEKRTTLQDAVRRLSSFPATNLGIKDRGFVKAGMKADLAIFDPATIGDKATFDQPQQFAVGMRHVFVNGQAVLMNGDMTGARPGRAVRGPGYQRCPTQ